MYERTLHLTPDVQLLSPDEANSYFPLLRPVAIDAALFEPSAMEVDVHALHQGYVKGLRKRGGSIHTDTKIVELRRTRSQWTVETRDGRGFFAPVVVNAAGAWAGAVGRMAGARPIQVQPLLRSVFMVAMPDGVDGSAMPAFSDIDDSFYLKPEGIQMLCSPADETLCEPGDAKSDELEIARSLDEIRSVTTLRASHVTSSWAGPRSFALDRNPVIGPDPLREGFFWHAGQGGYGIQTAAALARVGAALVRNQSIPIDTAKQGLTHAAVAVDRPLV